MKNPRTITLVSAERIVTDPAILAGKPTVRGTRISVELVLKRLAQDLAVDRLFASYPRLTRADVQACLAFAQTMVRRHRPPVPTRHADTRPPRCSEAPDR